MHKSIVEQPDMLEEQYILPENQFWRTMHVKNSYCRRQLVKYLDKYYVRDEENEFSLHYTSPFLKWEICGPNYDPELCVAIITRKNNKDKMIGFICGIKTTVKVGKTINKVIEINFLCVHPKYRNQQLAPILIKEVTRRAKLKGYSKAIYTGSESKGFPVAETGFWHRYLKIQPLIQSNFVSVAPDVDTYKLQQSLDLGRSSKYEATRNCPKIRLSELKEDDLVETYELFCKNYKKYSYSPIFSFEEFKHRFYDNKVVKCYVFRGLSATKISGTYGRYYPTEKKIIGMMSYFRLYSRVLKNSTIQMLDKAYLYYYVNTRNEHMVKQMLDCTMREAQEEGIMVFNALNIMDHTSSSLLSSLKFNPGTGKLKYFLHNWPGSGEAMIDNKKIGKIFT